jgi:hypothetical protein
MPSYSAEIKSALQKCRDYTQTHGVEYAIVLDTHDDVILEKAGNSESVEFTALEAALVRHVGHVMVHSHPTESTLSIPDLRFSYRNGVEVYAITPSGSIFHSRNTPRPVEFIDYVNSTVPLARAMRDHAVNSKLACGSMEQEIASLDNLFGAWEHDVLIEAMLRGHLDYEAVHLTPEFLDNLTAARNVEAAARANTNGLYSSLPYLESLE